MEYIMMKNGGRITKVEATNKQKKLALIENGFVEVDLSEKGKVTVKDAVDQKDYKLLLKEKNELEVKLEKSNDVINKLDEKIKILKEEIVELKK